MHPQRIIGGALLMVALALAGWGYVYWSAEPLWIGLGLATLAAGVAAFFLWARTVGGLPFGHRS